MSATSPGELDELYPGLYATPPAPLPFLAGVVVRSFLLRRETGNVLVYNAPGIDAARAAIAARGGATKLLVNHWHEALYPAPAIDVPVFVSQADRRQTERSLPVSGTFADRERIGDDIEIIPSPGHTAGTTSFVWTAGGRRFLFVGDTIWVHRGRWEVVLLGESDRDAYVETLARLAETPFDVLVPWGADAGAPVVQPVTRDDARREIDELLRRVRAGRNE